MHSVTTITQIAGPEPNPPEPNPPLLVVLTGPTASGKSSLAVALAQRCGGEVVSCDSVAVYRGLEIGAAKPSAEHRAAVPHHLLDVVAPDEVFSAGDYSRAARAAVAEIAARGRVPIVAGGTGLYLRALLQGLFAGPPRNDALRERLRQAAAKHGAGYMHRLLHKKDAAAATRIHENDMPKVLRALEVLLTAGTSITEAWTAQEKTADSKLLTGYRIVKLGLEPDRVQLYQRINLRAERMFAEGLVDETRALVEQYGPDCWALQSLGYRQAQSVLRGEMTEPQAIAATAQGHRNYAKRQGTWFRREQGVHWLAGFGEDALDAAMHVLRKESGR